MDELARRAEAMGGWEQLARSLAEEFQKVCKEQSPKKGSRGRPKHDLYDLDIIGQIPFPHYGGEMSLAKYISKYRKELHKLFGVVSDRTIANHISKVRKSCPPSFREGHPISEQEWNEFLKKLKRLRP